MSFEITDEKYSKNSSNSMIVKDILNEFQLDGGESKDYTKDTQGIPLSRLIDLEKNQNLLSVLKCKICLNILLNPYDCSKCGNTFCYSCINRLKESMRACPFGCCNYEIMPSSFAIKKFLEKLNFSCLNKENGCNEIISYSNIEQHDKNCKFINSSCPNTQCGMKMQWTLLENHIQKECPFTIFECPKCHIKLPRKELESHNNICNMLKSQFDDKSYRINKKSEEDIKKSNDEFMKVMNNIENLPVNENENKNINILIKSFVYTLSNKFGSIEKEISKINNTLQQFSENNLIFYQSINDELESLNEKICNNSNINQNSISNNNNVSNSNNNIEQKEEKQINLHLGTNSNLNINSRNFFPSNQNERLDTDINEIKRKRNKFVNNKKNISEKDFTSRRKIIQKSFKKDLINDINICCNDNKEKLLLATKIKPKLEGLTLNDIKKKEKFIQGMKSTKLIEKIKGIQGKRNNTTLATSNTEEKSLTNKEYLTIESTAFGNNRKYLNYKLNPETLVKKTNKSIDTNSFDAIFNNQEMILDKIQNLEKIILKFGLNPNSNNEMANSFKIQKNNTSNNYNSINLPSESPKYFENKI